RPGAAVNRPGVRHHGLRSSRRWSKSCATMGRHAPPLKGISPRCGSHRRLLAASCWVPILAVTWHLIIVKQKVNSVRQKDSDVTSSPDGTVTPDLARLGRRVRYLVLLYLAVVVGAAVASTVIWPELLASQPALAGVPLAPSKLGIAARLAALTALIIDAAPIIWAAYHALRLCQLMAEGRLFTAQVPQHLQRMGLALVLTA